MLLKEKNAVITVCAREIGKSILETFASNGANIWACPREPNDEFSGYVSMLAERRQIKIIPVYFDLAEVV